MADRGLVLTPDEQQALRWGKARLECRLCWRGPEYRKASDLSQHVNASHDGYFGRWREVAILNDYR